jgi:hypothetical protein
VAEQKQTVVPSACGQGQEFAIARGDQFDTIDPTSWSWEPTRCPVIVGNILLYRDDAQMVPARSKFISTVIV